MLFIHRSVGHHLLEYGNLRSLLNADNVSLDDYDNNNGVLTLNDGKTKSGTITMPGNNTNPDNLADFFAAWPTILNDYDLIMIKSCYPNSHIKDPDQLTTIQDSYKSIFTDFKKHDKRLLVLTTPPLRPPFTNAPEAHLANTLADWLVGQAAANNMLVFDLHHQYAETTGKHEGMLKSSYRRLLPWDNHPNRKAHKVAAPQIAKLIAEAY